MKNTASAISTLRRELAAKQKMFEYACEKHSEWLEKAIAAEALASQAREALQPFADCVFNDNGDMTVSSHRANHDDFVRAYFAIRALAKRSE